MLAYNLSPSFNWDTTGMTDEEMKQFPAELGKMGFVFNFITYGGHQIDGLAAEEFATSLIQEGMLSLAKLAAEAAADRVAVPHAADAGGRAETGCRADGGFRTHGDDEGHGQGLDAAPAPGADGSSTEGAGRLAADLGGTQSTLPPKYRRAIASGGGELGLPGAEHLERRRRRRQANIIFADVQDRHGHKLLSIRDMNTFDPSLQKKRLMTLAHLFLLHRYKTGFVHYLSPTEDNQHQAQKMKRLGIFGKVDTEAQLIIVAAVNSRRASRSCWSRTARL